MDHLSELSVSRLMLWYHAWLIHQKGDLCMQDVQIFHVQRWLRTSILHACELILMSCVPVTSVYLIYKPCLYL